MPLIRLLIRQKQDLTYGLITFAILLKAHPVIQKNYESTFARC